MIADQMPFHMISHNFETQKADIQQS